MKRKALRMFDARLLENRKSGTVNTLVWIHRFLYEDIHDFAGTVRTVNLARGNFRFAPARFLEASLRTVESMPQTSWDEIIEKYVEMNVAHPFRDGNGRSMRIWLDHILKHELNVVVDWSKVDKDDYLSAMEKSPVQDREIKVLLRQCLSERTEDRDLFMKGIDASCRYEGFDTFRTSEFSE